MACVPNWLMKREEITSNSKLVYARLCQYAGDDGDAFPSQATLAKEVGLTVRTLQRSVHELTENKLIHVEQAGYKKPNIYKFLAHEWEGVVKAQAKATPTKKGETNGRASRLQEDWKPDDTERDYAISKEFTSEEIEDITFSFINYYTNGKGRSQAHLNWSRTWQNWCRNERRYRGPAGTVKQTADTKRTKRRAGFASAMDNHLSESPSLSNH